MPKMKTHRVQYDLPAKILEGVGRVIVRWAFAEQYAQRLIYKLLRINPKQGRVAVSEPRLEDRYEIIATLAFLRDISLNEKAITKMKTEARRLKEARDLVGHGIWYYSKGQQSWMVQTTRGQKPDKKPATSRHANKRKVRPAGRPMDVPEMVDVAADIDGLIGLTRSLETALKSSRGKSQPPSRNSPPNPHKPKGH